jgi:alkylhydroperoxidase domain protein
VAESLPPFEPVRRAKRFTLDVLHWHSWLAPLEESDLTEDHYEALVERSRAKDAYFRLLVRDPEILHARTKIDLDTLQNLNGGLSRAEREMAGTAASRYNGCVYCVSVHGRFAARHSQTPDGVQRLLDFGSAAVTEPRWSAIVRSSVALSATPSRFGQDDIDELREAGLDDLGILDTIMSSAFLNWANRLVLSLGEPSH